MSKSHPFELYKMFVGLRTHFTSLKFEYGFNNTRLKYDNFYNSKNHLVFEKLSRRWEFKKAEEIFIANFIHRDTLSIHTITNTDSVQTHHEWIDRIKKIDNIFFTEIQKLYRHYNWCSTDKLKIALEQKYTTNIEHAMMTDIINIPFRDSTKDFSIYLIKTLSPESLCILNIMYSNKYGLNFLKTWYENKHDMKAYCLKILKYKTFININGVKGLKKIKEFQSII